LLLAAGKIADKLGIKDRSKGFRLVINHGKDAGESVPHLHVHLLAGRRLEWPPG
jgi:histidine triad (HIT) family protein